MNGLKDLIVLREADAFAVGCNRLARTFKGPAARDAAEQLITAAESIAANIAEGYGRGVRPDCLRFLRMAYSSSLEVERHLAYAARIGRADPLEVGKLMAHLMRVRFLLRRFTESVERRIKAKSDRKPGRKRL